METRPKSSNQTSVHFGCYRAASGGVDGPLEVELVEEVDVGGTEERMRWSAMRGKIVQYQVLGRVVTEMKLEYIDIAGTKG